MRSRDTRRIFLLAIVVLVSQLMCNAPTKEEAAETAPEGVDLQQALDGVFDVTKADVKVFNPPGCPQKPDDLKIPYVGPVVAFDFQENEIVEGVSEKGFYLTTPEGRKFFSEIDPLRPGKYCSPMIDVDSNQWVCISQLSGSGYVMTVEIEPSESSSQEKWEVCYQATHILTSTIEELLVQEIVHEFPEEPAEVVEQPEDDTPPQPEEPQQPELEPDPVPEFSEPAECNAAELLSISYSSPGITTSAQNETTCDYVITFTNIGEQDIKVFLYKNQHYFSGDDSIKWDNYVSLSVGESYEIPCEKETRNDDGTFRHYYIEKVATVFFGVPGCMNTFKNNSTAKEEIAVPLDWLCKQE